MMLAMVWVCQGETNQRSALSGHANAIETGPDYESGTGQERGMLELFKLMIPCAADGRWMYSWQNGARA